MLGPTRPASQGSTRIRRPLPSYDRSLHALRTWLNSWARIEHVAVGCTVKATICN